MRSRSQSIAIRFSAVRRFIFAFSYTGWNRYAYSSTDSNTSLANARDAGCNWVAICVWWFQKTHTSTDIEPNYSEYSADPCAVQVAVNRCHQLGMRVMLKPMVDLSNDPNYWRGEIVPSTAWFTSYTSFIDYWADFATANNCEMFCIGCELVDTDGPSWASSWSSIASSIRTHYSGPITGLIFCQVCGSVCYHRLSKNRKGEYHYYNCGCRQRNGSDTCSNTGAVREDVLIQEITTLYQKIFDNTDELVEDILVEAHKLADANRGEVQKVRGNMADLDRKMGPLMRLLADPDIDTIAKKAISRQIGELESERERLTALSVDLAERASEDTDQLTKAVHQALAEARENLASATTTTKLRDFIEQFVGPMVLKTDGTITRKETPPSDGPENGVTRPIVVNLYSGCQRIHLWAIRPQNFRMIQYKLFPNPK